MSTLESEIGELWDRKQNGEVDAESAGEDEHATLEAFLEALEDGEVRAAERSGGEWEANEWVKQGILLNFGLRENEAYDYGGVDHYDVLPLRETDDLGERGTRNTPDGTTIRRGAYLGLHHDESELRQRRRLRRRRHPRRLL
jgi:2,3,4,5-tetrahydropyridine-2,6-dicarboxylate N-succinyltransferase